MQLPKIRRLQMRLTFSTKLLAGTLGTVLLTIATLAFVNVWQANKSLHELGEHALQAVVDTVHRDMLAQYKLLKEKVSGDMAVLESEIYKNGKVSINSNMTEQMTIVSQVTKESETVELPVMFTGAWRVNDNKLVDDIQTKFGGTATIFQVLPGKLLRVSTNVRKLDGSRAVGTYIPANSPVYKTVMSGDIYTGKAYVVNQWYITAYKPLRDLFGEIVAVAYVGRPIVNSQTRDMITNANLDGRGYGFAYYEDGTIQFHPDQDKEGTPLVTKGLLDIKDGAFSYEYLGKGKTVAVRSFEPYGWRIAVGINDADMTLGADIRMMTAAGVVAAILLAVAVLMATFLTRSATKPLASLEAYTAKVADGDFDASINYGVQDAIGNTISAVQAMVGEMKQQLGKSQGVLDGMTVPCVIVDGDEKVTFINQRCLDMLEIRSTPEDVMGRRLGWIFYEDDARTTNTGKVISSGQPDLDVEASFATRNGKTVHVVANRSPLRDLDDETIGAFCLYLDITTIREQEEAIRAQNERIAQTAAQANSISEVVSSAAEELSAQVEQATQGASLQRERASETQSSMEQMNATVLEVAQSASQAAGNAAEARQRAVAGEQVVREVITAIGQVHNHAEELAASMGELGEQAEGIGKVITVIEDIADQTNLLALNAAIEAARAGDAGKGFAVVADEVRKLAEKTMAATKEVGQAISAIQQGAERSIHATENAAKAAGDTTRLAEDSGKSLAQIVEIAQSTADQIQSIAAAAEEQSAASEEINRAVDEVGRISNETADGMEQSSTAVTELARQAHELRRLMEELSA